MKTIIQISALVFGMFLSSNLSAQGCGAQRCGVPAAPVCGQAQQAGCPCDTSVGECWCLYVHYEPNYYNVPRCVEQTIPTCRTECRYVTKTYDVQRCRYVPEYYTETYSYQEPEYYQVPDSYTVQRTEYDQYVEYIPSYYWKHTCGSNTQSVRCGSGCAPTGCGR